LQLLQSVLHLASLLLDFLGGVLHEAQESYPLRLFQDLSDPDDAHAMEIVLIEFIFFKSIHQVRKRVPHTISVLWYSADFDGLPGSRVQNSILRSFFVDVTAPTGLGICNNVEHVVSCIRPLDPDCPRYTIFLRLRITNDKIDCRLYVLGL
jgi:hypothetical protein